MGKLKQRGSFFGQRVLATFTLNFIDDCKLKTPGDISNFPIQRVQYPNYSMFLNTFITAQSFGFHHKIASRSKETGVKLTISP